MDEPNHVFDDVEDALCAPVDENDISFENHPFPMFRQTRQASIQINRKRLQPFL